MNRYQAKAVDTANQLVNKPSVLMRVAGRAAARLLRFANRLGVGSREDFGTLVRLARAYANGSYRAMPKSSLLALVGALVYFLMPLDAIPDPILVLGFLDDVVVLRYALRHARKDLDAFLAWEAKQPVEINLHEPPASQQ